MKRIPFKSSDTNDREKLNAAFLAEGLTADIVQREHHMWIWVLCSDSSLWLLDKSHGGGGYFELQPEKRNV